MSEPSKKPPKSAPKKPATDLPDDEAIRKLFPKKVVDQVNREIGHKVAKKPVSKPTDKE